MIQQHSNNYEPSINKAKEDNDDELPQFEVEKDITEEEAKSFKTSKGVVAESKASSSAIQTVSNKTVKPNRVSKKQEKAYNSIKAVKNKGLLSFNDEDE